MADISDDEISLTSTVLSDQKSEYDVETIHAEQKFGEEGVKFLVQWAGYPEERCTWEPAESFSFQETLIDWEEKKRKIAAGKQAAFDVAGWEARLSQLEQEKRNRKSRRRAKRKRLGLLNASPSTTLTDKSSNGGRSQQKNVDSQVPCNSDNRCKSANLDQVNQSRKSQISSPRRTRPSVLFGSGNGASDSARPKKPQTTGPYKTFHLLSTKRRYEKARTNEPAPNVGELELMRPSEWAPISSVNTMKLGSPRLTLSNTNEVPRTSIKDSTVSPATSVSIAVQGSKTSPGEPPARPSPKDLRPQHNLDSPYTQKNFESRTPPEGPRADEISYPPKKIIPREHPHRFWISGEVFVSMYYGPEKKKIDHVRLCGLSSLSRKQILGSLKVNNQVEVWFRHLCTLEEYNALCRNRKNQKYDVGWIEGYDDTNPAVNALTSKLREENLIAICYLSGYCQNVLIAYSPSSPAFKFLGSSSLNATKSLNLLVRDPLSPIKELNSRPLVGQPRPSEVKEPPSNSLGNRDVTQPVTQQVNTRPSSPQNAISNPNAPSTSRTSTSILSPVRSVVPITEAPEQTENLAEPDTGDAGSDAMEIDTEDAQPRTVPNEVEKVQIDINAIFKEEFGISFDLLARVNGSHTAALFYIWFPQDSDIITNERELIITFLKKHTQLVYSNRVGEDWERFVETVKKGIHGVVLFHESFHDYHLVPSFRDLIKIPYSSFWSVSLSQCLQYNSPSPYFRRLFPHGTVLLITEDFMLQEPNGTLVTLSWFYELTKKRFPGSWKIMFRPDVLNWLLTMHDHDDMHRKGTWLAIYHWIIKLGATTDDNGNLSSIFGDFSNSSVISLPYLPSYGKRTETDHLDIPKNTSQEIRNADHLVEFFAGWGLLNCDQFRRFVILTNIRPVPERWATWQHIEVRMGAKDFMAKFDVDHRAHWDIVKGSSKSSHNSNDNPSKPRRSVEATPYTPRTPKPRSASDRRQSSSESALQNSAKISYPQPYQ